MKIEFTDAQLKQLYETGNSLKYKINITTAQKLVTRIHQIELTDTHEELHNCLVLNLCPHPDSKTYPSTYLAYIDQRHHIHLQLEYDSLQKPICLINDLISTK